jgi:hypothetical protein
MRRSACGILLALLCSTSLDATTLAPLTFEQLVKDSAAVVYGRVVEVRSQWTADRRFIESVISVEILKGLKGGARDTIQFTTPGGQVGRYRNVIPGAPVFTEGELAVFFLTAHGAKLPVTTGLSQGVYRVQRAALSGELLVMPPVLETGRIVRGDVRRKPAPLAAFEASVRFVAGGAR